jgi:hypothetical protein
MTLRQYGTGINTMTKIMIHIFDASATGESTDGNSQTHACSVFDAGRALAESLAADSNEVHCMASAEFVPNAEQLATAADQLRSARAAIGILSGTAHADLTFAWTRLPSALAAFAMPPETRGAILIDAAQPVQLPSENSERPIQELIIRAAMEKPNTVILLDAGAASVESPLPNADVDLPELAPRHPGGNRQWLAGLLKQLKPQKYFDGAGDPCEAEAVLAGLLQINDYLDESHNHSQSIQGEGQDANGDYWHGIMHRREPDYGNGKYWFRRVGHHPCFDLLPALAGQAFDECKSSDAADWKHRVAGSNSWDGAAFIDLCQAAERSSDPELTTAAKRIQWAEMLLLLEHSYRQACGR